MSEMRLEPSEPTPPPFKHSPTEPNPSQGSLAAGIGLAWLIVVGGHIVLTLVGAFVFTMLPNAINPIVMLPFGFLPEIAAVAVAIWLLQRGRRRTGTGMFIGLASIVAVCLLLVAACFGLFFSSMGH